MKIKKSIGLFLVFSIILMSAVVFAASTICRGQIVYGHNGNHLVEEVTNVFGSKAEIRWHYLNGRVYSGDLSYWDTYDLSAQTQCRGSVCTGSTVYGHNGNHLVGTVTRVFENGKTEIQWGLLNGDVYSGTLSYWNASELSVQTWCVANICANDNVYGNNGHHLVGRAQRVFNNGIVEVRWTTLDGESYSGSLSYWSASELTRLSPGCGNHSCR